jgi:hypothetical protein
MLLVMLLPFLFATVALAQIMIETPSSLIQCENTSLTWSGGDGMLGHLPST